MLGRAWPSQSPSPNYKGPARYMHCRASCPPMTSAGEDRLVTFYVRMRQSGPGPDPRVNAPEQCRRSASGAPILPSLYLRVRDYARTPSLAHKPGTPDCLSDLSHENNTCQNECEAAGPNTRFAPLLTIPACRHRKDLMSGQFPNLYRLDRVYSGTTSVLRSDSILVAFLWAKDPK